MYIIPAIDLLGGECVRLVRGDYGTAGKVADDPFKTAAGFVENGAEFIHMVDLDGAIEGKRINSEIIAVIAGAVSAKIEAGGGIRGMEAVEYYLSHGVYRVILGSSAVKDRPFTELAVKKYGERIAVGVDASDGFVRVSGWTEKSELGFVEFSLMMRDIGVSNIIYTDIGRDGTLSGPNLAHYRSLRSIEGVDITASGGIRDMGDIRALGEIGVYGAICGKSIYSGTLDLREAIDYTKNVLNK